jgi:solute carrier family 35 protein E1
VLSFAQHLLAFSFLGLVSPLTYSVANSVKRIFIIGLSVVVFGNGVGILNAIGIVMSVFGVLCYNLGGKGIDKSTDKVTLLPLNNNDLFV